MWFKNLAVYRFTEPFTLNANELEEKLNEKRFHPCGASDEFSLGWTSPVGQESEQLIHSSNGFTILCLKKEEKVLPSAVINEMLAERVAEKEEQEARKLSRNEKTALKEELLFELLPRAFSFSKKTFAYIDTNGGWIIVDAASAKKAEDLLSYLRKCLGSLPVVPLNTTKQPTSIMTEWLKNKSSVPHDISIENECDLRSIEDEKAIVRCKHHDLNLPEITNHLDKGKQVIKLAVNWTDRLSFIVDENLAIKRLKFLELIQEQVSDTASEDAASAFDVDFSIMSAELAIFLPRLIDIFGGEQTI